MPKLEDLIAWKNFAAVRLNNGELVVSEDTRGNYKAQSITDVQAILVTGKSKGRVFVRTSTKAKWYPMRQGKNEKIYEHYPEKFSDGSIDWTN